MEAREILIAIWKKNNGDWDRIYKELREKKYVNENYDIYLEGVNASEYITLLDDDYPLDLKISYKPPFVLRRVV